MPNKKRPMKKEKQSYVTITLSNTEWLFIADALDEILVTCRKPRLNIKKAEIKIIETVRNSFLEKVRSGEKTYV